MATANPLEEILNTEVDESAISAVLGSLESSLASPPISVPSQQVSGSSGQNNHLREAQVSGALSVNNQNTHELAPGPHGKVALQQTNSPLLQQNTPNDTKPMLQAPHSGSPSPVNKQVTVVNSNVVTSHSNVIQAQQSVVKLNNGSPLVVKSEPSLTIAPKQMIVGSTNVGTVVSSTLIGSNSSTVSTVLSQSVGSTSAIHSLASVAADQKPLIVQSQVDAKPPLGLPGSQLTVKSEGDQKQQVIFNVVRPGTPQQNAIQVINKQPVDQKPEVKIVTRPPNIVNAVVSSGLRTNTPTPASTSVITLTTRPMSTPHTVTVVRQPIAGQVSTATGSPIQVLQQPNSVMTPRATTTTSVQKTLAPRTVQMPTSGQVRIAANPGQNILPTVRLPHSNANTITLGQSIPPGHVLVRDPNGQLMMMPAASTAHQTPQHSQPIRVQSVRPGTPVVPGQQIAPQRAPHIVASQPGQPVQMMVRHTVAPAMAVNRTPLIAPAGQQPPVTITRPGMVPAPAAPGGMVPVSQAQVQAAAVQNRYRPQHMSRGPAVGVTPQQQQQKKQDDLENVRKCKNFLSTLLRLAASQPANTVKNVKALIQGLIESRVDPENFTQRLQVELKSSPQPYLVPFLKKSLPLLRQSMASGKMKIEGIAVPGLTPVQPAGAAVVRPGVPQPIQARPTLQPYQIQPGQQLAVRGPGGQLRHLTPQQHQMLLQQQQQQQQQPGVAMGTPQQPIVRPPVAGKPIPGVVAASQTKSLLQAKSKPKPGTPAAAAAGASKEKRKYDSLKDDDDINDVATMGGVNLTEESRNILATSSELMAGQMRSCKEEAFLSSKALHSHLNSIARRHGLDDMPADVMNLISHATEERLRSLLERLAVVAEHRLEIYKMDKRYEVSSEVRPQMRFLEELDRLEKKRHEEAEREVLLRAAKSRSKHEDPEQAKLKEKAKAMQQAELEQMRQREANLTALAAIGPRKKRKVDGPDTPTGGSPGTSASSPMGSTPRTSIMRPRLKRVNLRDLIFILEQEREMGKSDLLYKTFLK